MRSTVNQIDRRAGAHIHHHPRPLRVGFGTTAFQYRPGIGHAVKSSSLGFHHSGGERGGIAWMEHKSLREQRHPRSEVTASCDHHKVVFAECGLPLPSCVEVGDRGRFQLSRRLRQVVPVVKRGPLRAGVAHVQYSARHGHRTDSMMRRTSASMRARTGAVLSGLGAWLKYSEPRMKCFVLSVTKNCNGAATGPSSR